MINLKGEFILEAIYNELFHWPEEQIVVINLDEKYGMVNINGDVIIEPVFDCAFKFYEGLASIRLNGNYGCINLKGEIVIEPKY